MMRPRAICRRAANAVRHWHDLLFQALPRIETILAIGRYAQDYHFERLGLALSKGATLNEIVAAWRDYLGQRPRVIALPHPSWRNNAWLKRNPWFEAEVLPMLRTEVKSALR